jgi:FkbM family methyltransferase
MNIKVNDLELTFKRESNKDIPNYEWFVTSLSNGQWEKDTFNIVDKCAEEYATALDVGAWIGPISMYLSKKFDKVISIEPDKVAAAALNNNILDNKLTNIEVIEKVLFNETQKEVYFGQNENISDGLGESTSQSRLTPFRDSDYKAPTISFKDIVETYKDDRISFVKVDIEGGEENILEDLFNYSKIHNWKVWLSFHYSWWKNKDLRRFQHILGNIKTVHFGDNQLDSNRLFDYIINNQFGSFYLEF